MRFQRLKILKILYVSFLIIIFLGILLTPHLIRHKTLFLEENFAESLLLLLLLGAAGLLNFLYNQEINKTKHQLEEKDEINKTLKERLQDAFAYIGAINVQINAIRSLFAELDYPRNKKEMKHVMKILAEKILSIVPADWIILRIVDLNDHNTLREYIETRGEIAVYKHTISNKQLLGLEEKQPQDYRAVSSKQNSLTIKAFCIMPKIKLSREQEVLIGAALTQLEMLFLIFGSRFYKHYEQEK